jgi:hypothetical protein
MQQSHGTHRVAEHGFIIINGGKRMNWLQRQMMGRYGNDQLNIALLVFSIVLMLIGRFSGFIPLMYLGYVPMAACIYRTLSRKIEKRRLENYKFAKFMRPFYSFVSKTTKGIKDRKFNKYYHCPSCKQRLRVPKGKGTLIITCPKCKTRFERKT